MQAGVHLRLVHRCTDMYLSILRTEYPYVLDILWNRGLHF